MIRPITLALLALWLFQAPVGSIEGKIIRADTDQPIANVQVLLFPGSLPIPIPAAVGNGDAIPAQAIAGATASVVTGADGKFVFKDLKRESYRVVASVNGYVRREYGQRATSGQGKPLSVAAGQSIENANIQMVTTGTVKGRVLDEKGQPAAGAIVQLLKPSITEQGKFFQSVASATVDDRGDYRIFGATPGRYFLMAGTQMSVTSLFAGARGNSPAGIPRFSQVYFPNSTSLDQATTIEVKSGNESSIDMHVKRQTQRFHVRGRVVAPAGTSFPQNLTMMLGYRNFNGSGSANMPNSFDPATGMFDISAPNGDFTVEVAQATQSPVAFAGGGATLATRLEQQTERVMGLAASVPVHISDADIDGLVLNLNSGIAAKAKLTVEGQPLSTIPNLQRLRLNLRSVLQPTGLGLPQSSAITENGSFQIMGLREGAYRIQFAGAAPGFYLKAARYGSEDILGKAFNIRSGSSESFEFVIKSGTQIISGTVVDSNSRPAPDATVVFVPAQRESIELFHETRTDSSGKFTMTNVTPGEYKVFSWDAIDTNAYLDPDFLAQYEQLGKSVTVTENFSSSVEVKLIPAP